MNYSLALQNPKRMRRLHQSIVHHVWAAMIPLWIISGFAFFSSSTVSSFAEESLTTTDTLDLTPFTCSPDFYQIINGQLFRYDVNLNDYTSIGPDYPDFNATGYNVEDNLIYGLNSQERLVVIDAEGTLVDLGEIRNLPQGTDFVSGDFDLMGNLHVGRNVSNVASIYRIDVDADTLSALEISLSEGIGNIDDMTFNPVDSFLYSVNQQDRLLIKINPVTGDVSSKPTQGIPQGGANLGAIWSTSDGSMYVSNNSTGDIYLLDIETGVASVVAKGRTSVKNDGSSCPLAVAPIEGPGGTCMDGIDNDGDGDTDCEDSDCACACLMANLTATPEVENRANGTLTAIPTGGTPPYAYQWSTDPVQTDSMITGLTAGMYRLTLTDADDCVVLDSVEVMSTVALFGQVVIRQPVSCQGSCDGEVEINAFGGVPPYSFEWPDGSTDTLRAELCAGEYEVTITDQMEEERIAMFKLLPTKTLPVASFEADTMSLMTTFTDLSTANTTAWEWDFGDGQTAVEQNPVHAYAESGTYTVCLIAGNDCGRDTICQDVTVQLVTGVWEVFQASASLFPNPTSNDFRFEFSLEKSASLSIFLTDLSGRLLKVDASEEIFQSGWHSRLLSLADYPPGVYLVVVRSGDFVWREKMIKI
jgi:hypothetical protein